jgi:hypothetical protein
MKRFSVPTLFILFSTLFVSAQKIDFGVRLGFTEASLHGTYDGLSGNTGTVKNIDPMVCLDVNFGNLTVQPGLAFYVKGGGNTAINSSSFYFDSMTGLSTIQSSASLLKIYYLELPVNVLYNFPVKAGKFFIGAGPYLAMGVSATSEIYQSSNGNSTTQSNVKSDVSFGSGQNDLRRFDLGINALGGFRFNKGIELALGFGQGLTNVSNDNSINAKNQTATVTLGYFF